MRNSRILKVLTYLTVRYVLFIIVWILWSNLTNYSNNENENKWSYDLASLVGFFYLIILIPLFFEYGLQIVFYRLALNESIKLPFKLLLIFSALILEYCMFIYAISHMDYEGGIVKISVSIVLGIVFFRKEIFGLCYAKAALPPQ